MRVAALAQAAETAAPAAGTAPAIELDPVSLILNASGPVFVVVWLLIIAAILVWFIAVLKLLQIRRWRSAENKFEKDAAKARDADTLFDIARHHGDAPGARVVFELQKRRDNPKILESAARRAVVGEQQRASTMLPTLASIGSAAPFIGLFGTVYGIMDAFLRIGREKSASLPVVAPAIGEALIATAIGLFAAIPAVIAYNAISKRMDDLMDAVEASSDGWVALIVPSRHRGA
ncbi:MAG: MotA/TolQ/ExbB proton channel family protein [Polyangiaceae bacterium]